MFIVPSQTIPLPRAAAIVTCAALTLVAVGCSPDKKAGDDHGHGHSHAHDHATVGPHRGMIVEWGDHEHHLELKFDRSQKQATVYVVDHDVKKVQPTAVHKPLLKLNGVDDPIPFVAQPLEGETAEKSSQYVATHDVLAGEKPFSGAITGTVGKHSYFGRFKEEKPGAKPADHEDHDHEKDAHKHDTEKKDAKKKDAAKTDDHEDHDHGKHDHDHPHDDHPHDDKDHDHTAEAKSPSTEPPQGEAKTDDHKDHDHGDNPPAESPKPNEQPPSDTKADGKKTDAHDNDHS